jgi:hypothetical protein
MSGSHRFMPEPCRPMSKRLNAVDNSHIPVRSIQLTPYGAQ